MNCVLKRTLSFALLATISWGASAQAQLSAETLESIKTGILGDAGRLDKLRYVDVRDLLTFGTDLQGTSKKIMEAMESSPGKFLGPAGAGNRISEAPTHINFLMSGPKGPDGSILTNASGKKYFDYSVATDNSGTRLDTILSAHIEKIEEEVFDKVFKMQMIMFVHDSRNSMASTSNGYYFRRLNIRVDWTVNKTNPAQVVQVLDLVEDIPLSQTQFKLVTDILERKVILEDKVNNIWKVFPIGVGGFDIRTGEGMSGDVRLQTDEFPVATLKSVRMTGDISYNSRSRIIDSYFRGRPFIAVYLNGKTYKEIGFHYQIDTDGLRRGFVSHGCIRVRDMDLYVLDIILNEGPRQEIDATLVYDLQGYDEYLHPMPKRDSNYRARLFSNMPTTLRVDCSVLKKSGRTLEFVTPRQLNYTDWNGSEYYSGYHEVVDEDCLAKNAYVEADAQVVMDYIEGRGNVVPPTPMSTSAQHYPLVKELELMAEQARENPVQMNPGYNLGNDQQGMTLYELFQQGGYQEQQAQPRQVGSAQEIAAAQNAIRDYENAIRSKCRVLFKSNQCHEWENNKRLWEAELRRLQSFQY